MKKKYASYLMTSLSAFLLGGTLIAQPFSEETTVPNSRPLSEKVVALLETEEETAATSSTEPVEETDHVVSNHQTALFNRYHSPIPYRYLMDISEDNDCILLDDKSHWRVDPDDLHKLSRWRKNDTLLISVTKSWGKATKKKKKYYYTIINESKGASVKANLFLSANVHNIDSLNREGLQVYINGTGYAIAEEDRMLLQEWETEDTVLFAVYAPWDHWLTSYDIALINVDSNHYVRAKRF